jgi:hypothetical protein
MANRLSIVDLTQQNAIDQCEKLWWNSHLITNNEWMAVARNIEAQDWNWSWWSVGNWYIDNWLDNISTPNGNWTVWCYDDDNTYADPTWAWACSTERQLILSNWEKIWDLAWNVWEHTNKANTIDWSNYNSSSFSLSNACWWNAWYSWHLNDWVAQCSYTNWYTRTNYWPLWEYNASHWVWRIYSYNTSGSIFLRGGGAGDGASTGLFTLNLHRSSASQNSGVGFRCSW